MTGEIVTVKTTDDYFLHGFLSQTHKATDTIILHIHGSAGNFYQSTFYPALSGLAKRMNIAFLTTNNRGTGVYDVELGVNFRGAAIEMFEECLIDIDAWIKFVLSRGYKQIILEGHSFGTNKVQYYALHGMYRSNVIAIILLGFTDSFGGQLEYLKSQGLRNEDILAKAKQLIEVGKPLELLSPFVVNWGELPQTAQSYWNFMQPNSSLSQILPLGQKKELNNFQKISVPILGIVGDRNECTVIDPKEAVERLNKANPLARCYQIPNSNHKYEGREQELVKIVEKFLKALGLS